MPYQFTLSGIGSETEEGVVVAWFKREGAEVREGEPLLEVQVAKTSYEVAAPVSGRLYRVFAPRDAIVREGQSLALILLPGEEPPVEEEMARSASAVGEGSGLSAPATPTAPAGTSSVRAGTDKVTIIPLSPMRAAIAHRMEESLHNSAQLTLVSEADVTELVEIREKLKKVFHVTYTDLVIKAAALSLQEHPYLNARLVGEEIHLVGDINIGMAVAVEGGLIVPVLPGAHRLTLRELAQETARLADLAREGKLTEEETQGGTFTVTTLGKYGVDAFTPILNPPEVGILGVGRLVEKPRRRNGELCWRQMMTLSLTFDHRLVDGAPAAAFLQTLRERLENPMSWAIT